MGGTAWRNLEMSYGIQSGIQDHRQAPFRRPQFYFRERMCIERGRQLMLVM